MLSKSRIRHVVLTIALALAPTPVLAIDEALLPRHLSPWGMFAGADAATPEFSDTISLDLSTVVPSLAGPKRPQDRVTLAAMRPEFRTTLQKPVAERGFALPDDAMARTAAAGDDQIGHGAVVIAAITSCTNTSNPSVMVAAGLVARKAVERGLTVINVDRRGAGGRQGDQSLVGRRGRGRARLRGGRLQRCARPELAPPREERGDARFPTPSVTDQRGASRHFLSHTPSNRPTGGAAPREARDRPRAISDGGAGGVPIVECPPAASTGDGLPRASA